MKASANSGLGAQLREAEPPEGFRSLSSAQCLWAPLPGSTEAPAERSGSGPTKCLCRLFLGHLQETVNVPVMGHELRWTQSHSSAIRGVAPIQTQIPTEIQSPSCCERQPYAHSRTPLSSRKERWFCAPPCMHRGHKWTQCVCLKERNGKD